MKTKRAPNPLLADPSRTTTLRKALTRELDRRFAKLKSKLVRKLHSSDSFTTNDTVSLERFKAWLATQLDVEGLDDDEIWKLYAERGYKLGLARGFDDKRQGKPRDKGDDFYQGGRKEFLRSSFSQPVAVERVQALASRSYESMTGITETMSDRMTQILADGLVTGDSPAKIAKGLSSELGMANSRARTVARTEIVRAHASGQILALKNLGVTELGVQVEFKTAGDDRVCDECDAMEGTVTSVEDAEDVIPVHPNCRCAWIPMVGGEDDDEGAALNHANARSVRPSLPPRGRGERGAPAALDMLSVWLARNIFCATGEGGGVDPSCSPGAAVGDVVEVHGSEGKWLVKGFSKGKVVVGRGRSEMKVEHAAVKAFVAAPLAAAPAPAPAAPTSPLLSKLHEQIDAHSNLNSEQKRTYKAAMAKVVNSMPPRAADHVSSGLDKVEMHGTAAEVTASYAASGGKVSAGSTINGLYRPFAKVAALNGQTSKGDAAGMSESGTQVSHRSIEGTYAHELGHVVDRDTSQRDGTGKYSRTTEWKDIHASEELSGGRLSKYANTDETESFAEFHRLMHGTDVKSETIAARFPRATKFMKDNGLWRAS